MLNFAIFIKKIKHFYRLGLVQFPASILNTPFTTRNVWKHIGDHLEELKSYCQQNVANKAMLNLDTHQVYSLLKIHEGYGPNGSKRSNETLLSFPDTIILEFDDLNEEKELVYSIRINHEEKFVVR